MLIQPGNTESLLSVCVCVPVFTCSGVHVCADIRACVCAYMQGPEADISCTLQLVSTFISRQGLVFSHLVTSAATTFTCNALLHP